MSGCRLTSVWRRDGLVHRVEAVKGPFGYLKKLPLNSPSIAPPPGYITPAADSSGRPPRRFLSEKPIISNQFLFVE